MAWGVSVLWRLRVWLGADRSAQYFRPKDTPRPAAGLRCLDMCSLKSDHVNVSAGPTKDNDVCLGLPRSAWAGSKSPPNSRTAA